MPRPGQAAFFAARLAVSVVAGFLGLRVLASALDPASFIGAVLSGLLSFVVAGVAIVVCVSISGALFKKKDSKDEDAADGNSATAKMVNEIAKTLMKGSGKATVALARKTGPHALHLGAAATGALILWVGLGRGGLVAAGSRNRRPANPLLGWAHGLIFAASSGRTGPASLESGPLRAAIEKAIKEVLPPETAKRLRFHHYDGSDFESDIYEWRMPESGHADYKAMRIAWEGLTDAVRFRTGVPGARCEAVVTPKAAYQVIVPLAARAFPGDEPSDGRVSLLGWIEANSDDGDRFPRRFAAGLDFRGTPVIADLAEVPNALFVGQIGSGKSLAIVSAILQLAAANPPDRFALWLCDPKEELGPWLRDLPHTRRVVTTKDGRVVDQFIADLRAEAERRYSSKPGYKWSPATGDPFIVCVIDELQAITDDLIAEGGDAKEARAMLEARISASASRIRASGVSIWIGATKGTSEVIPAKIVSNLPLHFVGASRPADLDQMVGDRKVRVAPRGRMALVGTREHPFGEPVLFQGFVERVGPAEDPESFTRGIEKIVRWIIKRWGGRTEPLHSEEPTRSSEPNFTSRPFTERPEPRPARPAADPDAITQRLASEMSPRTAARILRNDADRTRSFPPITRDTLRDLVTALGLVAPNNEKMGAALLALEGAGVLEAKGRSRTLKDRSWPVLSEMLDKAGL
jgi:hypothetical protein